MTVVSTVNALLLVYRLEDKEILDLVGQWGRKNVGPGLSR